MAASVLLPGGVISMTDAAADRLIRAGSGEACHPDQIARRGFLHSPEAPLFYYGAIRDSLALAIRAMHTRKLWRI